MVEQRADQLEQQCLRYVLRERAGAWSKLFDNSPYPCDCDAHGVRPDRRTLHGEGMRLADFVQHPDSRLAQHVRGARTHDAAAADDLIRYVYN